MPHPQKKIKVLDVTRDDSKVLVTIQNNDPNEKDAKCYVGLLFQGQEQPNYTYAPDPKDPKTPKDGGGKVLPFGPNEKRYVTFDPPPGWLDLRGKQSVTVVISLTDPDQAKSVDKPTDYNTSTHNFFI